MPVRYCLPVLPLLTPVRISSGQDSSSVDMIPIVEVMIIVHSITKVTLFIMQTTGADQSDISIVL